MFVIAITAKSFNDDNESTSHSPLSRIPKSNKILQGDTSTLKLSLEENSSYLKALSRKYSLPTMQLLKGLFTQEITEPLFDISKQPVKNKFHGLLP